MFVCWFNYKSLYSLIDYLDFSKNAYYIISNLELKVKVCFKVEDYLKGWYEGNFLDIIL